LIGEEWGMKSKSVRCNSPALLLLGATTLAFTSAAQAATGDELEEIVITGSRVITNGNDSPTPVTVVTTEELTTVHPGNLVEAMNDMPLFNGSRSQNSNPGNNGAAGSPAGASNSTNQLNLRQMGVLRTLILYDGHRAPPSTPDGSVDVDTIPQLLLQRVDVVTGGVSAVYGSDGIVGAVNFVTDTKFEGIKGNLQAGRSVYGDADTSEGGLAFGTSLFGGRGHLMGSFETRHSSPIESKFDRAWGRNVYTLQGFGTTAQPYYQVIGARNSSQTYGGRVSSGPLANYFVANSPNGTRFDNGGYLVPFVRGTRLGLASNNYNASGNCGSCEIGGDGGTSEGQLRAGLDMNQIYGRFDFDFTDDLHGYLSAADTLNRGIGRGNGYTSGNYAIRTDNAFLLPQYRTALGTATQFTLGKMFTEIPRQQTETHSRQLFVNAGLQGSLGDYKWDLALTKSNGSIDVRQNKAIDQGRFFAALDSVVSNGVPVCRASLTNAAYAGCVPLNPFGQNAGSQAAIDYFIHPVGYETKIGMEDVAASITGAPFSTWAGPVNTALSGEWRKLRYEIDSGTPDPATGRANCTGIAAGCTGTTTVYNTSVADLPKTSQTVSEAAVEVNVPLLKDKSFAQSLDASAAFRVAHYNTLTDNAKTWKVGLTWDPFDQLTVRATRSRDFRAPSLDETFRTPVAGSPNRNFADYLPGNPDSAVNLNANASSVNSGNLNLKPELGDTLSYGIVVRPTPNFDISVDAFKIKVTDAIFVIQGNTPAYQNACYAGGGTSASNPGTSPFCQLIVRDATNHVIQWKQSPFNLAEVDTWGADIELGYKTSIADHPLSVRLLTTYQPHLIYKQPSLADFDYAGAWFGTNGLQSNPVWRATGFVSFKPMDSLTVNVQERWRSSMSKVDGAPDYASAPAIYAGKPIKAIAYTNLNLTYTPRTDTGKLDFFVSVQNLFNTDPPQAGFWGNPNPGQFGEVLSGDDIIGRFYTVGVRFKM
jgi:iron complex outermembrane recepter protein